MTDPDYDDDYEPIFGAQGGSVPPSCLNAESVADTFEDQAEQAAGRVRDDVGQIRELAADVAQTVRGLAGDCISDVATAVRQAVGTRPIVSIVAAAGAGYVLARLRDERSRH